MYRGCVWLKSIQQRSSSELQMSLPISHDRRAGVMTSISFATPLELANEAFVYWFEPT